MVTDYDCWREATAHVEVANVLEVLQSNADTARRMVATLAAALPQAREPSPIDTGLDFAVITDPAVWDRSLAAKLSAICPRKFSADDAG
ncbi:MAG: hypothetical protein LPJ86_10100 [Caulobacteraceae bacterium]|nr:hypothetical protein [Caulobacteraceae bacterium]